MSKQSPFTANSLNAEWVKQQSLDKVLSTFSHIEEKHVIAAYQSIVNDSKLEALQPPVSLPSPENSTPDESVATTGKVQENTGEGTSRRNAAKQKRTDHSTAD